MDVIECAQNVLTVHSVKVNTKKNIFWGLTEQTNKPNNKESLIIFRHLLLFYYYYFIPSFSFSFRGQLYLSSILCLFFQQSESNICRPKNKNGCLPPHFDIHLILLCNVCLCYCCAMRTKSNELKTEHFDRLNCFVCAVYSSAYA